MPDYYINGKRHISAEALSDNELEELAAEDFRPSSILPKRQIPEPPQVPGILGTAYETVSSAPLPVRKFLRSVGESVATSPMGETGTEIPFTGAPFVKGFLGGAIGGVGKIGTPEEQPGIASFFNPLDAADIALSGGSMMAARKGFPAAIRTARNLGRAAQVVSAPVAAHGAHQMVDPESTWSERAAGLAEFGGGMAGMMQPIPNLPGPVPSRPALPSARMTVDSGPVTPPPRPPSPEPFIDADIISRPEPGNDANTIIKNIQEIRRQQDARNQAARAERMAEQSNAVPMPETGPPPVEPRPASIDRTKFDAQGNPIPEITPPQDFFAPVKEAEIIEPSSAQAPRPMGPRARNELQFQIEDPMGNWVDQVVRAEDLEGLPGPVSTTSPLPIKRAIHKGFQEGLPSEGIEGFNLFDVDWPGHPLHKSTVGEETLQGLNIPPEFAKSVGLPESFRPSEMRVPGTKGPSGLPNIALGGASPRVLDVLGTSLYTKDRPSTTVKELLQNSVDEMKISGNQGPIRVAMRYKAINPATGQKSQSIVVKDHGRGMTPDQLYTVFSNVGETGKGKEPGASGGFGFAKAAPFLGGDHMRATSIVQEGADKVKYVFEGNPAQFKNQEIGVPVERFIVTPDTPTGLEVEVFFPEDKSFYSAERLLKDTVEGSPGLKGVEFYEDYLDENKGYASDFVKTGKVQSHLTGNRKVFEGQPIPELKDTIKATGAKVDVHYELDNKERTHAKIVILNNGLYVMSKDYNYGRHAMPHVPDRIIFNIKSTVEEGQEGYPFGANREELNRNLQSEIEDWIKVNLKQSGEAKRRAELQKTFDSLAPAKGNNFVTLDSGGRYKPEEMTRFNTSRSIKRIGDTMETVLGELHELFPEAANTAKFGFQIAESGKGGINIPNPGFVEGGNAILINPLGAMAKAGNPEDAARRMVHVLLHEFTHNTVRNEGAGFTWQLAETYTRYSLERQLSATRKIQAAISDNTGQYTPEIQSLLREYTESRGRAETTPDLLGRERESEYLAAPRQEGTTSGSETNGKGASLYERLKSERGVMNVEAEGQREHLGKVVNAKNANWIREAWNLSRGMMSVDPPFMTSAAFRQGLPFIGTKNWFKAWAKAAQAFSSETLYQRHIADIQKHPYFTARVKLDRFGRPSKNPDGSLKPKISWAEEMGLELTDLLGINNREEVLRSTWAEKIPVYGKYIRASNRAYTAFLNELRAKTFVDLMVDQDVMGLGGKKNEVLAKEIADFINTATGRGKIKLDVPTWVNKEGVKTRTYELEKGAKLLTDALFSPRLMASRVKMLNPTTYVMGNPYVRKQYAKAMLRAVGAWWTIAALSEMAFPDDVTVSKDPTNADFGKIKIGDTRIDAGGGFQQYLVLGARTISGGTTSSTTGKYTEFGKGYRAETLGSTWERFGANKLHPTAKLAYDLWNASEQTPVYMGDRLMQMYLPMMTSDLAEIAAEDPDLGKFILTYGASGMGAGAQTYAPGPMGEPVLTRSTDKMFGTNIEDKDVKIEQGGVKPFLRSFGKYF